MAARVLQSPLPTFNDLNGSPLTGGYLYFGDIDTDPRQSPLTVYWDEAKTIPATQPIRTTSGYPVRNGAPADVWIDGNCSILVLDSQSRQVSYVAEWIGGSGFVQTGTGAVTRTMQDKAREIKSVFDFMTEAEKADVSTFVGVLDHTASVQKAINTGYSLAFPPGVYNVNNLTQTTGFQVFWALGRVALKKNANGPILTSSGTDVEFNGIGFRGEASTPVFTGDNLVSSGTNLRLINCGSRWAFGRAVKATGDHVQIIGTCDIYQTADATATGYDIEIGVSGTATLYHHLYGIKTSQSAGGVKFVDCGSQTLTASQIGKLYIAAGTKPGGVNGGHTVGCRILGNVTVEQSNAVFAANQFSAVAVTFAAGTAQCSLDKSNVYGAGATITNNGSKNNLIEREVSTGGTTQIKYGDDASSVVLTMDQTDATQQFQLSGSMVLPNTRAYRAKLAAGTVVDVAAMSSGDVLGFGNLSAARVDLAGQFVNLVSAAGTQAQVVDGGIRPFTDNTKTLGTNTLRWSTVHTFQVKVAPVTVANLPSAGSAAGTRAFVSDATATTFASIVAGGGANNVPVYSDGTSWRIG